MVRFSVALCALSMCACGEEERLQPVAPSAMHVAPSTAAPSSPYSIAPPAAAAPAVAMPADQPHVIPRAWLTAEPSPLYIFSKDYAPAGPQSVTLTNRGSTAVTVNAALSGSATLALDGAVNAVALAPGDSLQVTVSFAPNDHERAGATLAITDSAGAAYTIPIAAQLLRD